MITKEENIIPDCFYWLEWLGEQQIGKAINFYGEIRFRVTGFDDLVEFSSVKNVTPVCLFRHDTVS